MKTLPSIFVIVSCLVLSHSVSSARTWYVRQDGTGDALTIKAGIDSSGVGDTVLVADGTYYEHGINLKSGIVLRGEAGNPATVIVDGQQLGTVLYCIGVDNTTSLEAVTIKRGRTYRGGGMYCENSDLSIINCVFSANWVDNGNDNSANEPRGGGIYMVDSSPALADCQFMYNQSAKNTWSGPPGGGEYAKGGAMYCVNSAPAFSSCTFIDNLGRREGGAIFFDSCSPVAFTSCEFESNEATYRAGGAILVYNSVVNLIGCAFIENSIRILDAYTVGGGAIAIGWHGTVNADSTVFSQNSANRGGAINGLDETACNLNNCEFSNNRASYQGGALSLRFLSCVQCNFDSNVSSTLGGALALGNAVRVIDRCAFTANQSASHGGACYLIQGSTQFKDCDFIDNRTTGSGNGGSIWCEGGKVTLTRSDISGSSANHGGAVYMKTMLNSTYWDDCSITDCSATYNGGGIYLYTGYGLNLDDCAFTGNSAGGNGGACFLYDRSTMNLNSCTIDTNHATGWGGGFYIDETSSTAMDSCRVFANSANGYGGGMAARNGSHSNMTYCVMAGNRTDANGGGISVQNGNLDIGNCTLAMNSAEGIGGGIYMGAGSAADIDNVIIAFSGDGAAVGCEDGGSAALACSDVFGNADGDWAGCIAGQEEINDNFSANPFFCGQDSMNFSLYVHSPCMPGYHPEGASCGLIGALGEGCTTIATELAAFACATEGPTVILTWTLSVDEEGVEFLIERAEHPGGEYISINSPMVIHEGRSYKFTDSNCNGGAAYKYRVSIIEVERCRMLFETEAVRLAQLSLGLDQNIPNPFNPATTIRYYLPEASHVVLSIYDSNGGQITTLVNRKVEQGKHAVEWNGKDSRGIPVASGVYFYRLKTDRGIVSKKMVLLK